MSSEGWIVSEDQLPAYQHNVGDILFSMGNGILGVAAAPPLAPRGAQGIFAGGMYAEGPPQLCWIPEPGHAARDNERFPTDEEIFRLTVPALIACPQVFAVQMTWNGQAIDAPGHVVRSLDLKQGELSCALTVEIPGGTLILNDRRIVSLDDRHLLIERLEVASTTAGTLQVRLEIDATVKNKGQYDLWAERTVGADGESLCWHGVANSTGSAMALCQGVRAAGQPALDTADPRTGAMVLTLDLAPGTPAVIERFIGVGFTIYDADVDSAARNAVQTAMQDGYASCAQRHHAHWQTFWQENDIRIEGSVPDQLAVRYALFQLHCGTPPCDGLISMGAKFLTGEWYHACVFWDTDVFIGPYLTRAQPAASRAHLLYRYRTLPEARNGARQRGFDGALYPLQSLPPSGIDATTPWTVLGKAEIHTSCDVAWAILDYFRWTGDTEYMEQYGAAILVETARFWMSRLTQTTRGLELQDVCGPDEYHPFVHNSVYNSILVRENLTLAAEYGKVPEEEKRGWREAAARIFCHQPNADGVVEQCDGFFALPDWHRGISVPKAVEYQLIKQADVIMLPVMLPELYSKEITRANYEYYEPHCVHESSLSAGVHAIVAARLDMLDEAYDKFRFTAYMEIEDRLGNTHLGLHAACIGMVPRIVMEGFAGLRIENGIPVVSPHLPSAWTSIQFAFSFQGSRYRCHVERQDGERMTATITPVGDIIPE